MQIISNRTGTRGGTCNVTVVRAKPTSPVQASAHAGTPDPFLACGLGHLLREEEGPILSIVRCPAPMRQGAGMLDDLGEVADVEGAAGRAPEEVVRLFSHLAVDALAHDLSPPQGPLALSHGWGRVYGDKPQP
jgi:hypothetical protein